MNLPSMAVIVLLVMLSAELTESRKLFQAAGRPASLRAPLVTMPAVSTALASTVPAGNEKNFARFEVSLAHRQNLKLAR